MPFAIAAAGISAAGAIGGSLLQADATKSAQSSANAAQQAALDQSRADLAPYNTQGALATTDASNLLGLNGPDAATAAMGNFQTSPGYQFSLDQGLRAVDAGAAAHGMLRSGAALKAEQTFGTGLADQEFSNYYNRLFSLANLGENAAAKTGANAVKPVRASLERMSAAAPRRRAFTGMRRRGSVAPSTPCSATRSSKVGRVV